MARHIDRTHFGRKPAEGSAEKNGISIEMEAKMPAKSKAQQMAAGAALAAKRGETRVSALRGASREMYKSMSERELEEFASTKRKGKPEHVRKAR